MTYEVFVWVPSKGWKSIMRTRIQQKAIKLAMEFVPLEVKLTNHSLRRTWHSGQCHTPLMNTKCLHQIEDLNESINAQV